MQIDSRPPSVPLEQYMRNESRFTLLDTSQPQRAKELQQIAQSDVDYRWRLYESLAQIHAGDNSRAGEAVHAGKEEKR